MRGDDEPVRPLARGGRRDRRHRVPRTAPRPSGPRRPDRRPGTHTRADAVLRGHRRAGRLLRGERDAGRTRPAQARRRRQLRGRARVPLQRPRPRGGDRRAPLRHPARAPAAWRPARSFRSSPPSWRAGPRSGRRRPTSPGSSGSATSRPTWASSRWPISSTHPAPTRSRPTIEMNASGEIYPVVYVRRGGARDRARVAGGADEPLRRRRLRRPAGGRARMTSTRGGSWPGRLRSPFRSPASRCCSARPDSTGAGSTIRRTSGSSSPRRCISVVLAVVTGRRGPASRRRAALPRLARVPRRRGLPRAARARDPRRARGLAERGLRGRDAGRPAARLALRGRLGARVRPAPVRAG